MESSKIHKITHIASDIEKDGYKEEAKQLDKLASKYLKISLAQYVGYQGYWIANERCWQNCYRQKRAKRKNTATQVIWSECQQEYVDYVEGKKETWEKYAENIQLPLKIIKQAQKQKVNKYINKVAKRYNSKVAHFISKGSTPKQALVYAYNQFNDFYQGKIDLLDYQLNNILNSLPAEYKKKR